ncbi:hypothetical protein [Streptomyces alboflavus]|uniref:hypothetical protein n=1 Tax=Streptomyces alboflavus TaxID=67267 RepID=UPI000A8EAD69|nr:hypothetical protein [Streptomyces alboflavus]
MTPTAQVQALLATAAPTAPVLFSLTEHDRRAEGDDLPTIPAGGIELTAEEAAAALFEVEADLLEERAPNTDALYAALKAAVSKLGPAEIANLVGDFAELDNREFPEVGRCRRFGYRLALSFWYEGARSRSMTCGEAAVAVYFSGLNRYKQADFWALPKHRMLLARALYEGLHAVPLETLIRLGAAMDREFGDTLHVHEREWLYRQALPDYHRRRFAYHQVQFDRRTPIPLIVRPNSGGYTIGLTPPPGPDGRWLNPVIAEW